jgi:hypothetical protein
LVILNQLDAIDRAKADQEAFKRALAARPEMDLRRMWPEYFQEEPKEETPESGEEVTPEDLKNVNWKSPSDDPKGWEEMMSLLAHGTMSGDEVTGNATPPEQIEWTEWR